MRCRLPFTKMVGAGNDFIVLDLRHRRVNGSLPQLARQLCRRGRAIGADGLLTVEPSRRATVKMRILNPDGSQAEMCGNGVRCVAWYAARGHSQRHLTIETKAGLIQTTILPLQRVRAVLTTPSPVRQIRLTVGGRPFTLSAINTGVPHAVLFVPTIQRADVERLGPAIRRHRRFRPTGTNVDFVQVVNRHTLRLRTYERGVEAETLACGTGAVAAALAATSHGQAQSPVNVYPTSGERLIVRFRRRGRRWRDVSLEGEVRRTFDGVVTV